MSTDLQQTHGSSNEIVPLSQQKVVPPEADVVPPEEQEPEETTAQYDFVPEVNTIATWNASGILRNNYNYTCSRTFQQLKISDLHICGDIHNIEYKMIFFTTMYYSASSAQFFRNTLHVIASMKRDHNVQPVLFIESPRSFVDNNATNFIQSACDLG